MLADRGLGQGQDADDLAADAAVDLQQVPEELEGLERQLADTYFCNFSVFQSLPDSWAIDQLFPVMPIHRLDEKPRQRAVLADITCDCDGKIDRFIDIGRQPGQLAAANGQKHPGHHRGVARDLHLDYGRAEGKGTPMPCC